MFARYKIIASLSVGLSAALIAGCASTRMDNANGTDVAGEKRIVPGTGIQSQDIVAVADKMARGIMAVPEIARAQRVVRIVMLPVNGDTQFAFNKDSFLNGIMARLNERAAGKVRFEAGDRSNGGDYMLAGKLAGQTTITSAGTTDYVLYSFDLIEPKTTEIVWNGSHRIKKQSR